MLPKNLIKIKLIKKDFEKFSDRYFRKIISQENRLTMAMRYSFFGGGKRVRAILCKAIGMCFGCNNCNSDLIAFGMEAIHTYSLIHDDLPAMDNDSLRRGKKSCHVRFDEATAILSGNALQTLGIRAISEIKHVTSKQIKRILLTLCDSIGFNGLMLGQQLDIMSKNNLNLNNIEENYKLKTGKVFSACVLLPFMLSPHSENKNIEKALINFSEYFGLAFQIKDDLTDMCCIPEKTKENNKTETHIDIFGIKASQEHLKNLIHCALETLDKLDGFDTQTLHSVVYYVFNRK